MASHRSKKQESCAHENCGSRRFHVGEDGFTYCDQGHQQSERGTVIAEDTGELVQLGRKSRKKDSDAESATSRGMEGFYFASMKCVLTVLSASSFSGSHASEHYLLCFQLVLRKQLYWLVHTQKFPEELEGLVKDLWALRLQRAQKRVVYESGTETEAPSSQVFSSQSESEATSASRSARRSRKKQREKVQEGSPRLMETLALCYIGLLLLRLPVTVADIHRWTNDGELLYYRTPREVPLGMRERLPPRYQAQLEPQDLLQASSLHAEVLELLKSFNMEFGMAPPVPNVPLILYRWLRELMLPVEVYAASNRLARVLDVPFEFELSPKATSILNQQYPEARLMGIVVVATKLLFPLDDLDRYACSETDLSVMCMDWKEWARQNAAARESARGDQALSFAQSFNFDEEQCHSAGDDELDAYLDWYQDNIATEEIRERGRAGKDAELRRAMFAMFPSKEERSNQPPTQRRTPADDQAAVDARLRKVQGKLRPRAVLDPNSSEGEVRLLGSCYRRFRDAGELSGVVKEFYERAAELAGLPLDGMVQVVFAMERKMQKIEERLRKKEEDERGE